MIWFYGKKTKWQAVDQRSFRDYLDRLLDDINKEAESERNDTAELQQLEQMVADRRAALIKKRENLANLEREAASLLAARTSKN